MSQFLFDLEQNDFGFCCRGCNQWWCLASVILLIGVGGIITVSVLRVKSKAQPDDVSMHALLLVCQ